MTGRYFVIQQLCDIVVCWHIGTVNGDNMQENGEEERIFCDLSFSFKVKTKLKLLLKPQKYIF